MSYLAILSEIPGTDCVLLRERKTGKLFRCEDNLKTCVACGEPLQRKRRGNYEFTHDHHCKEEKISRRNRIMAEGASPEFFVS